MLVKYQKSVHVGGQMCKHQSKQMTI